MTGRRTSEFALSQRKMLAGFVLLLAAPAQWPRQMYGRKTIWKKGGTTPRGTGRAPNRGHCRRRQPRWYKDDYLPLTDGGRYGTLLGCSIHPPEGQLCLTTTSGALRSRRIPFLHRRSGIRTRRFHFQCRLFRRYPVKSSRPIKSRWATGRLEAINLSERISPTLSSKTSDLRRRQQWLKTKGVLLPRCIFAHHRAVQNEPHDRFFGKRAGVPRVPVGLHLAPDPAHRILADRAAKQGSECAAHPACVGAGKVGARDQRVTSVRR